MQWQGRFWRPGRENEDQRGTLTYSPDRGVRLALIGAFDDGAWLPGSRPGVRVLSSSTRRWPVLYGTVGSARVTLFDCAVERSTSHLMGAGVARQEIRAQRLFVGVLLDEEEHRRFSGVRIELENLTEWHCTPDIGYQIERYEDPTRRTRWSIEVEQAEPIQVDVDDLTVELARWYRLPSHDLRRGRLESSTFAVSSLTLRSSEPRSAEEWAEAAGGLQDLLSLAMDAPCAVLRQTLIPTEALLSDQHAAARKEIPVYARHVVVGDPDAAGVQAGDALFTLGSEGVSFEAVIPLWLETRDKFRMTINMILGLRYMDAGYVQTELITAVAAAESMHEALDREPPITNSEFKGLRKQLLKCVPEERRQWLREKLGRNGHTLRQRLIDLASIPDAEVMHDLLPNAEAWAEAAKKARNFVAHGGQSGADDFLLQHAITEVTRAVIIVNLLHCLEIPKEQVRHALMVNRTLSRAARLAAEHWPALPGAQPHSPDAVVEE
ncbi:ApeA N-terminal domain 1-containing protein [Mycobacterium novum]